MNVKISFFGGLNEIGGNKVLFEYDNTRIFLDFGRAMNQAGKYYEEFIKVRSKCALLDLLKLGILPKVNGIHPSIDPLTHFLVCKFIPGIFILIIIALPEAKYNTIFEIKICIQNFLKNSNQFE